MSPCRRQVGIACMSRSTHLTRMMFNATVICADNYTAILHCGIVKFSSFFDLLRLYIPHISDIKVSVRGAMVPGFNMKIALHFEYKQNIFLSGIKETHHVFFVSTSEV